MSDAIVLCADDYGHSAPISRAILDLAKHGRISALSCMAASPLWPEHGHWLAEVKDKVDIGLHITLVDETPLTKMPRMAPNGKLPSIGELILKSHLGMLDMGEVTAEIQAQLAAFQSVMGFGPQHIDGHLHTHVLPGIRSVVLSIAQSLRSRPWVRNIKDSYTNILKRDVSVPKAALLAALGSGFARTSHAPMNDTFSGVYGFEAGSDYAELFEHFATLTGRRHVILCHPGEAEDSASHTAARAREYAYFKSDRFLASLVRHGIRIGRFGETAP
jgi:chitin disaccharide deacetylase